MNIEQIKSILAGAEESLRLLQNQPEYQTMVATIETQNGLTLSDAIQALGEIYEEIDKLESPTNLFDLLGTDFI